MSNILGAQPSMAVTAGFAQTEPRRNPPLHAWIRDLEQTGQVYPTDILSKVLENVKHLKRGIVQLRAIDKCLSVDVYITIKPFHYYVPYYIDPKLIKIIADFGASLDIDFYDGEFA